MHTRIYDFVPKEFCLECMGIDWIGVRLVMVLSSSQKEEQVLEKKSSKTTTTENLPVVHWDCKAKCGISPSSVRQRNAPISQWNY